MKKNNAISLFKFFMAICVIAIHTVPLNENIYHLYRLIIRTAVPFFILCSGYFLFNKVRDKEDKLNALSKMSKKMLKLYIIWSCIYLPITIYFNYINYQGDIIKCLVSILINYIFIGYQYNSWQLWYLLGMFYSLVFYRFLIKKNTDNYLIFIISCILLLLGQIYRDLLFNINSFSGSLYNILTFMGEITGDSGGRIISVLFYLNMGIILYKNRDKIYKNRYLIWILTIVFTIVNYYYYFIVFRVIFNVLFFMLCLTINLKDRKIYSYLRTSSIVIYFIHMMVYSIYSYIIGVKNPNGFNVFCFTLFGSIIISIIYIFYKNKRIKE